MRLEFKNNSGEWQEWFAWHPVWIGDTLVWLESVSRRWIHNASYTIDYFSGHCFDEPGWEYRL